MICRDPRNHHNQEERNNLVRYLKLLKEASGILESRVKEKNALL